MNKVKYLPIFIFGMLFGIVLFKADVVNWNRIRAMFEFREAHLFLIIGSAVITGMIAYYLLKRFIGKTVTGEEIVVPEKKFNKGYIFGGLVFGAGWALTGACPGPIFTQIGSGEYPALVTLAGAIAGTYIYSIFRPKLPH